MSWTGWSAAEDAMLVAHYPERGPSWRGWADLLPGRSKKSIITRAGRLGVKAPRGAARGRSGRSELWKPSNVRQPGSYDQCVRDCMADGLTPSQIDRKMHWPEGKAKQILMGTWDREDGR